MPCLAVRLLLKDQIVQHDLPRCISGIVHRSDPRQLVSGLHMLRNALHLRHLLDQELQHLICLTVNFVEMVYQLAGGFQIDIGHSAVHLQILEPYTAKAPISRAFRGYHQVGQVVVSVLVVCNFLCVTVLF